MNITETGQVRKSFTNWPGKWSMLLALLVLAGSWSWNLWLQARTQLPHPVFLEHRAVVHADRPGFLQLHYLENRTTKETLAHVISPEFPEMRFVLAEHNRFRNQREHVAFVQWETLERPTADVDEWILQELSVVTTSGRQYSVPIGEVRLQWGSAQEQVNLLKQQAGGGSSSGEGFFTMQTSESLQLEGVRVDYLEELRPWLSIEINDQPLEALLFPVELSKGASITVRYTFQPSNDTQVGRTIYHAGAHFSLLRENGERTEQAVPLNLMTYLNDVKIKAYVQAARGGEMP